MRSDEEADSNEEVVAAALGTRLSKTTYNSSAKSVKKNQRMPAFVLRKCRSCVKKLSSTGFHASFTTLDGCVKF